VGEGTPVTGMSAGAGASVFAHGVHYSVLGVGLLGLVVLLGPHLRPSGRRKDAAPYDDHDRRILLLRSAIAAAAADLAPTTADIQLARRAPAPTRQLIVPLAVVSSAAAAGVHAAVGPAHFREQTLFGLFFAGAALAQVTWSTAVVVRSSRVLLSVGATGNAALIALWLFTRTVGLPGLLPGPEEVGPWDLACVGWELVVVVACVHAIRVGDAGARLGPWPAWHRVAHWWALASVLGLGLLSVSGAGS
jgi:hypothetical protein